MTSRLNELIAMREQVQREIDIEHAIQWRMATLRDSVDELLNAHPPAVADVLRETAAEYGLQVADLLSADRSRAAVVPARHVAAWLLRDAGLSYSKVGDVLRRDHTTVMHSVKRVGSDRGLRVTGQRIQVRIARCSLTAIDTTRSADLSSAHHVKGQTA